MQKYEKLSSVEKQVIHEIVNQNIERLETSKLEEKYEKLKNLKPASEFQATSTDNEEDNDKEKTLNERLYEGKSILDKTHTNYGSLNH